MRGSQCFQRSGLGSYGWSRETETLHGCVCDLVSVSSQPTLCQIFQHWSRTSFCRPNTATWKSMKLTSDQQLMWSQMQITEPLPEEEQALTEWHEGLLQPDVCSAQSDTCSGTQTSRSAHEDVYLACCGWDLLLKWNHVGSMWLSSRVCTLKYFEKGEH